MGMSFSLLCLFLKEIEFLSSVLCGLFWCSFMDRKKVIKKLKSELDWCRLILCKCYKCTFTHNSMKHTKTGFIKTQVIALKCKLIVHKIQVDDRRDTAGFVCTTTVWANQAEETIKTRTANVIESHYMAMQYVQILEHKTAFGHCQTVKFDFFFFLREEGFNLTCQ